MITTMTITSAVSDDANDVDDDDYDIMITTFNDYESDDSDKCC